MRTPEEYQNMAAQCSHLASAINDPDSKVMLLETAQTWIKLADYAAKAEAKEPFVPKGDGTGLQLRSSPGGGG